MCPQFDSGSRHQMLATGSAAPRCFLMRYAGGERWQWERSAGDRAWPDRTRRVGAEPPAHLRVGRGLPRAAGRRPRRAAVRGAWRSPASAPASPATTARSSSDPAIDAVAIATPSETHYRIGREALLAGKHLFVEKPLALSSREGQRLVDLARERRRTLMVGHLLMYHPAVIAMAGLVRARPHRQDSLPRHPPPRLRAAPGRLQRALGPRAARHQHRADGHRRPPRGGLQPRPGPSSSRASRRSRSRPSRSPAARSRTSRRAGWRRCASASCSPSATRGCCSSTSWPRTARTSSTSPRSIKARPRRRRSRSSSTWTRARARSRSKPASRSRPSAGSSSSASAARREPRAGGENAVTVLRVLEAAERSQRAGGREIKVKGETRA